MIKGTAFCLPIRTGTREIKTWELDIPCWTLDIGQDPCGFVSAGTKAHGTPTLHGFRAIMPISPIW
jgi:hypothetical protein